MMSSASIDNSPTAPAKTGFRLDDGHTAILNMVALIIIGAVSLGLGHSHHQVGIMFLGGGAEIAAIGTLLFGVLKPSKSKRPIASPVFPTV